MNNSNLIKQINDLLVIERLTLNEVARQLKTTKKDILNLMKNNGFIFDRAEGYFLKEETLLQRIIRLEEQQVTLLKLLKVNQKKEIKIDSSVLSGKVIPRTFKLYENTSENFTKFCNEHKKLKMQEILTVALEEYMDRNK